MKSIKYDIGFVILHYIDVKMTVKCVNELAGSFSNNHIFIVIVDNCSPNNSGIALKEKYDECSYINVIINSSNLGFAKGNNVGYSWLRENIDCRYIGIINNDLLIKQNNIMEILEHESVNSQFAVLGPDIVSLKTGKHQNPVRNKGFTYKELLDYCNRLRKDNSFFLYYYWRHKFSRAIRSLKKGQKADETYKEYVINPVLHGACYFFSREFMDKRDYAFNAGTFMFFEEDILQYECLQLGLKLVYCPRIQVIHCEDVSTKKSIKNRYYREKWISVEGQKSGEFFLELMDEIGRVDYLNEK